MAIDTIKFKRGVKSKLNNLSYGEPAYISDENELYIGTENGVEKITRNKEVAELSSQLEQIVTLANDDIQEKLNKGGHIKLIGNINLTRTLYIKDNTILEMDSNSKIISNFDGVILQVEGNNVEIRNVNIDCNNNACTGIFVNSNSKDITIKNNSVKNSHGGNSKAVYGIFVSSIGCRNVVIDNNIVDNISSEDDGTLGDRDGGWAKGILVDLYDLIQFPSVINQDNISQNIIISNNQISNISDVSDADGIYIEGYKPSLKNNIIISNNSLYNCHKRFIKVLNASDVQILNNYAHNDDDDIVMHAHISLYSSENTVLGNTMVANSRYGVELGYQSKYEDYLVKDIVIDSNKFDVMDKIDYGAVICRGDFTGRYKDIVINNNILIGGRRSVFLTNGTDIETIKITNNTCRNLVGTSCFVEFDKLNIGQLNIENNRFVTDSQVSNIVMAYPSSTGYKVNTCIISNNISSDSIHSAYSIKYVDNLILADNKINSSIPYALVSVTNSMVRNNYNLKTSLPCEGDNMKTFEYKPISSSTIDLDISSMSQVCSLKVAPSVATTLTSLVGEVGQIVNIINANSTGFTINHSNNIHLKSNANLILTSMEQCITLIRLDNRWLEISRNF